MSIHLLILLIICGFRTVDLRIVARMVCSASQDQTLGILFMKITFYHQLRTVTQYKRDLFQFKEAFNEKGKPSHTDDRFGRCVSSLLISCQTHCCCSESPRAAKL